MSTVTLRLGRGWVLHLPTQLSARQSGTRKLNFQ